MRRFLLLLAPAIVTAAVLVPACSASEDDPKTSSNATTGGAGGSGGGGAQGGQGGGGGESPIGADCAELCGYLESIMCDAFANCAKDCPNMFDAPDDCADEFAAMLSCWVGYKMNFMCTMTQVVPPEECKEVEAAFNACFEGQTMNDGGCPGQVCSSTDTTCACKTGCGTHEYKSACQLQGSLYACSCYDSAGGVDTLIGTCTEQPDNACDNQIGCCAPFFVP